MEIKGEAKLLRIFCGTADKVNNIPLYEFLVYEAKREGLAGATVLKGLIGYGATSRVHSAKFFELSEDLPVVVEIVDEAVKIDTFILSVTKHLENLKFGALITTEKINVIHYAPAKKAKNE
jgi:PII-like signaling protein